MRVQPHDRVTPPREGSHPSHIGKEPILLILTLMVAFGLGFLAHQQRWYAPFATWMPNLVRQPGAVLAAWKTRSGLPVLSISLGFSDFEQLVTLRDQALQVGVHVPVDGEAVSAEVGMESAQPLIAEIRLPAGPAEQLQGDTWPFEMRFDGDLSWARLIPVDSTHVEDMWQQWGYLDSLRREGFPAASGSVVRLRVNGSDWGLYMLEAPPKVDPVVWFGADESLKASVRGEVSPAGAFRYASVGVAGSDPAVAESAGALLRAAMEGIKPLSEVADPQALGHFMALTQLWTGAPAPDWRAIRWTYSVASGKLVPVGVGQPLGNTAELPGAFLDDPVVQRAYVDALMELSQPAYLQRLRDDVGDELEARWYLLGTVADDSQTPWAGLEMHQKTMRARLSPERPLLAELFTVDGGHVLRLANLQPFPLLVEGLDMGDSDLHPLDRNWVAPADRSRLLEAQEGFVLLAAPESIPTTVDIHLPAQALQAEGESLSLVCRLWGAETPEVWMPLTEGAVTPEAGP